MNQVASRRSWVPLACFLAAAVLFYFGNRQAYGGYFSDDDLDNLGWPTYVGNDVYYHGLLALKYDGWNFRPVGSLYYRYLYRAVHLYFPPYVVVLQLLHGLNVALLYLFLRRLDFSRISAGAGALFYSFHAAVLEIFWKPMYVFDLLCATLCLITLLLYVRGRWIVALIPFWLAYKSKEVAVMLPAALLAWEWLIGERKWKRLIPYFLISLIFGLQVLWWNRTVAPGTHYAFQLAPEPVWQSVVFYSSAIFFSAYAGLALLALPIWVRDRHLYLGLIFTTLLIAPMLALHQVLATVYWYVPMIGMAIVIASIASRTPRWAIALLFLIWLPWNFALLREKRGPILAEGARDRSLVAALSEYAREIPPVRAVVYQNRPEQIQSWGIHGAISLVFGPSVESASSETPDARAGMAKVPMALIRFRSPPLTVRGLVRTNDGLQPYLRFTDLVPESQFGAGWYDRGSTIRRIAKEAECEFHRPAEAIEFDIVANVPRESLRRQGPSSVTVLEDGHPIGAVVLSDPQVQTLRWKLSGGDAGDRHIKIVCKPVRHGDPVDPRVLGIAVRAIGYASR
jgi:hypothetical protein